jgi:hypothetical protein
MEEQPDFRVPFECGVDNLIDLWFRFYAGDKGPSIAPFRPIPEHLAYPGHLHKGLIGTPLDVSAEIPVLPCVFAV